MTFLNELKLPTLAAALGLCFASAPAGAQTAPPEPAPGKIQLTPGPTDPPQGKIDLATPPPATSVPRSYRMHDGFYTRLSGGFGVGSANLDDDAPSGDDLKGSGQMLGFDLLIGGSPAPGVAIGGALLAQGSVSAEFERGSFDQDRTYSLAIIGPFIDGFPQPHKGWHLGGTLGLAVLNVEDGDDDVGNTSGFGGAAWFGYDFWVADEWSIGPEFRLAGTLTRNGEDDVNASSFSAMFLFTALYH